MLVVHFMQDLETPTVTPESHVIHGTSLSGSSTNTPLAVYPEEGEIIQDLSEGQSFPGATANERDNELPPPLPKEPPPCSSSSGSSAPSSQDLLSSLDRDPQLPQIESETSVEDWHTESSTAIIAPPDGFLGLESPPRHPRLAKQSKEELDDEEDDICDSTMHSSTPKLFPHTESEQGNGSIPSSTSSMEGFRRAQSNPSISGNRVVMSVIASPSLAMTGHSQQPLNRACSEDIPSPRTLSKKNSMTGVTKNGSNA